MKNLLIIFSLLSATALYSANPFEKANSLFNNSQYLEAIEEYEKILNKCQFKTDINKYIYSQNKIEISYADMNNAMMCLGQAHWAIGEYEHGYILFDQRLKNDPSKKLEKPFPLVPTQEALTQKTVLVRAEYGLGDTFGFMKYGKILKTIGAKVILLVQNPLKELLYKSKECADLVINAKDTVPSFDYEIYMMSLPHYFSKAGAVPLQSIKGIPHFGAYIYAKPEVVQKWYDKLKDSPRPLGICWAASANPVPGGRILKRDIPLVVLAQLTKLYNVKLYSLQGGGHSPLTLDEHSALEENQRKERLIDLVENIQKERITVFDSSSFDKTPFEDTAAVMQAIKMLNGKVISVDTSTANLAGAMDVPTCMLMGYNSDSRWGERSPGAVAKENRFYKSVKEFWQTKEGEWDPVIKSLIEYLKEN